MPWKSFKDICMLCKVSNTASLHDIVPMIASVSQLQLLINYRNIWGIFVNEITEQIKHDRTKLNSKRRNMSRSSTRYLRLQKFPQFFQTDITAIKNKKKKKAEN